MAKGKKSRLKSEAITEVVNLVEGVPPTKNVGGRPRVQIDWDEFERLCEFQCTLQEVAAWFRCSDDTVEMYVREHYKRPFSEVFREKRGKGKVSLRRKQMQMALEGCVPMAIFLGKQYLNQYEKREYQVDATVTNSPKIKELEDTVRFLLNEAIGERTHVEVEGKVETEREDASDIVLKQ